MAADLNEHHRTALHEYMRFARYLRGRRLKAVDGCFIDVRDSVALQGETYTRDEVCDLLDELQSVVRADVESELINVTHSNAILLQGLFAQAEKWHLKLNADTTNLENRDLLEGVRRFEEDESRTSSAAAGPTSPSKARLEPLNEVGASALLQLEIDRLQEDNMKLRDRLKMLETKTTSLLSDRNKLSDELNRTKVELDSAQRSEDRSSDLEVSELRDRLISASAALERLNESSTKQRDLEGNFVQVKHELLRVTEQLESAEKELDKKVSEATAYVNLKKMVQQKNDVIKTLRKKLTKYEPDATEEEE